MCKRLLKTAGAMAATVVIWLAVLAGHAAATIQGIEGTNSFNLTAGTEHIFTGEGNSVFIWAYGISGSTVQYPGPTLIVNQGDVVTITLTNQLPVPTSIVFPGQLDVQATGGTPGLLTREAAAGGGVVTYTFVATHPGTYLYHSGTRQDLQVEMGLFGALIVRPAGFDPANPRAYASTETSYDNEYLFLLSEMDHRIHQLVEFGRLAEVNTNDFYPVYWFVNGRNFPDTILDPGVSWLPTQPYNSFPMLHPGETILLRVIGAGRDLHPFHTHGNNTLAIAENGRVLTSTPDAAVPAPDLARSEYTISSVPGQTVDALFTWTGKDMGWDFYGAIDTNCTDADNNGFDDASGAFCHDQSCFDLVNNKTGADGADGYDDATWEYCEDHGTPFPVALPNQLSVVFGEAYSGSPFLGMDEPLPPDHVSINPFGAFMFPWHSHHEKEMVNNDIFIGGMMSVLYIIPPGVAIPF